MRPVPGSPLAQFLETLSPDDPRHYGMSNNLLGPRINPGTINSFNSTPFPTAPTTPPFNLNQSPAGTSAINNLTLPGISMNSSTQQATLPSPMNSSTQQATLPSPMMGGSFGQSQPMGSGGFGQSQPMGGGGLKSLLDNYFSNFLTSYFQQNLR